MSKHIFEQSVDGNRYEVQIGWDKPCRRFYYVISPYLTEGEYAGDLDDPVDSNLYLSDPDSLTLADIQAACERRGITLPPDLLGNVEQDRLRNAVNERRVYHTQ